MPPKLAYEEVKPPMQLAAAGCFDIFDPARTRTRRKRRHQPSGPKPFTDTNGVSLPPTALQLVKLVPRDLRQSAWAFALDLPVARTPSAVKSELGAACDTSVGILTP